MIAKTIRTCFPIAAKAVADKAEDINIDGLDGITLDTVKGLLDVDKKLWMEDANGVEALYDEIGARVPAELRKQLADLKARLA